MNFGYYAVVVEWQTRYLEGVVGVRPWRFESSLPHLCTQKEASLEKSRGASFFAYCIFVYFGVPQS